jgi:hypothetical protein
MRGYPEFNFPAFRDATAKLRALGHGVFSPAERDQRTGLETGGLKGREDELRESGFDVSVALAVDLKWICEWAEAVVVLPGWSESLGAAAEIAAARALHKPVWPLANVLRGDEGIMAESVGFLEEFVPPTVKTAFGWTGPDLNLSVNDFRKGRNFESGAYRDSEDGKLDFEGFLSPAVLFEFADYMHEHRTQSNGEVRDSDNWQKGIPRDVYMKSMFRHFMDVWANHRDPAGMHPQDQLDALMALLFNVQGYAHEILEGRSIVGD